MAIVAPREEAASDDVLVWRYAAERAHQAAEAARARAREAAAAEPERRGLRTLGPTLERAVRSVKIQRNPARRRRTEQSPPEAPAPSIEPSPEVWAAPSSDAPEELPARDRLWTPEPARVVTLDDILADSATVPLPAALIVFDDVLEWLQRLHATGATYGELDAGAVDIDTDGRSSLRAGGAGRGLRDDYTTSADLQAAAAVFTTTIAGTTATDALPLPARCLVEQAHAVGSATNRLSAARLRVDLAVAARAFLDDGWDVGGRAWLGSACATAAVELTGRRATAAEDGEGAADTLSKRRLFAAVSKRDPRMLIGLGVAATASVALVVGTAVGLSGSHTATAPAAHQHRPAISTPAPVSKPTAAAASSDALPQPTAAVAPPAPPTAVPTAPPAAPVAAPQVVARPPAPVTAGPVIFTPVAAPATPISSQAPTPAPTQCILGILCP